MFYLCKLYNRAQAVTKFRLGPNTLLLTIQIKRTKEKRINNDVDSHNTNLLSLCLYVTIVQGIATALQEI